MNTTIETPEVSTDPKTAIREWMKRHGVTVEFTKAGIRYSQETPKSRLTAKFHYTATVRKGDKWDDFSYSGGCAAFLSSDARKMIMKGHPGTGAHSCPAHFAASLISPNGKAWLDAPHLRQGYEILYNHSTPEPESLLDCLKLDAGGPDTFDEWADEFGYDKDSRAAEKTFRECREDARRLRAVLGRDAFLELMELESL